MLSSFSRGTRKAAIQIMGLGKYVSALPSQAWWKEDLNPDFSNTANEQICSEKHFDTLSYL